MTTSEIGKFTIDNIFYTGGYPPPKKINTVSCKVVGLDTEADVKGRCFMLCTSTGDIYRPEDIPDCLFKKCYRGHVYVAYNLKYDAGAILQFLPMDKIQYLQKHGTVEYGKYIIKAYGNKCYTIRRNKMSVSIYDMFTFFHGSLEYNASTYLGEHKKDIKTKSFNTRYIKRNWNRIAAYCIQDAKLVKGLADLLISKFEAFGVYPKKLFSVAYISFKYFTQKKCHINIKEYWDNDRDVIDFALRSYNGGKFEVTEKGTGDFYEYDIISAYPYEIRNLVNIKNCRVVRSKKYYKTAVYSFLKCHIKIPMRLPSPVSVMRGVVNTYPYGEMIKVITKNEYEYLTRYGADVEIIEGKHLMADRLVYPYRREIDRLVKLKQQYKREGKQLDLHTVKIFLNSLYGKFIQLIEHHGYYTRSGLKLHATYADKAEKVTTYFQAGESFNPVYASVITSNCRIRITDMQRRFKNIIAVHTDSIISKTPLPFSRQGGIGDMIMETSGKGVILGTGIYQIGDKTKIRGVHLKARLDELIGTARATLKIKEIRPYTWREVAFHGWDKILINQFHDDLKKIKPRFDTKRLWINDYNSFQDVFKRNIDSLPFKYPSILY